MLPMKNPAHPGRIVESALEELKISVLDAAKNLGVTRQQLHNVIAGRSVISAEMAVRLEKALGSTADTWLRMQMNYDLAQIRKRKSPVKVKRMVPMKKRGISTQRARKNAGAAEARAVDTRAR